MILGINSIDCCFRFQKKIPKIVDQKKSKSNFHYTRAITPKRVTSGGNHLRGLAPGQHSSDVTSQRWRAVGDTVSKDALAILF